MEHDRFVGQEHGRHVEHVQLDGLRTPTTLARIRVRWAAAPVSDTSNVNFAIAVPSSPSAPRTPRRSVGIGTQQGVTWTTNLGPTDNVRILLSTNGGASYTLGLAGSTPNDKSETITVPYAPTSLARVRVEWPATRQWATPATPTSRSRRLS